MRLRDFATCVCFSTIPNRGLSHETEQKREMVKKEKKEKKKKRENKKLSTALDRPRPPSTALNI